MKDKIWKAIFIAFLVSTGVRAQNDSIAPTLSDTTLINYLRTNYYPSTPRNYDAARDSMYQYLDVDATDSLTCVYSGLRAEADGTRTPSNGSLSFNTEHSWPQSFYDNAEPMRGDIHHLFPAWSSPNQSRSNHPFGEIDDNNTTSWWYWENGGSVSSIPSSNIDLYSEYGGSVFEPREDHKGNVARAMFYFWTIYADNNDVTSDESDNQAFFDGMKSTLYQWHQQDPVTAEELARSEGIESIQGNKNPFIHDTTLIRRAYFQSGSSSSEDELPEVFISEVYEANGGTVKYLELYNRTDSTINFTSDDWSLFRFSNSNTSGTEISLAGSISSKSFFVIGDDNSSSGVQTIFGEDIVDQDESSINHNGNDKYALVKNSSSNPDTVDWFGKDNIGNSSSFSQNQVLYRVYDRLPNNGSIGQTSNANDGDTTSTGYWRTFDISSSNGNGRMVATPGYNKGIESDLKPQTMLTGSAGWRLISIPGNNVNLNELTDDIVIQGVGNSGDPNIFTYNNSGSYDTPSSLSETVNNGEGFAVFLFDNDLNGSTSLPNVLDISSDEPSSDVTVNLNTTTAESGSYFTLVGNPFQSNFDLSTVTHDNTLQTNVHVLENGLYSPVTSSSSVITPWQGFWVESVTSNAATQLTFPTSGKTSDNGTTRNFSKVSKDFASIQFNLKTSSGTDRGCRIDLNPLANYNWDRFDASKIQPSKSDYGIIGCLQENKMHSVLSIPSELTEIFEVDLLIDAQNVEGNMELDWISSASLFDAFDVTLTNNITQETFVISDSGNTQFQLSVESKKSNNESQIAKLKKAKVTNHPQFTLSFEPKSIVNSNEESGIPEAYSLQQNYPNPFNPTTQIRYSIQQAGKVRVVVRNTLGQKVATLVDRYQSAGNHTVTFNAKGLSSGVYFYSLETLHFSQTKKMLLIK